MQGRQVSYRTTRRLFAVGIVLAAMLMMLSTLVLGIVSRDGFPGTSEALGYGLLTPTPIPVQPTQTSLPTATYSPTLVPPPLAPSPTPPSLAPTFTPVPPQPTSTHATVFSNTPAPATATPVQSRPSRAVAVSLVLETKAIAVGQVFVMTIRSRPHAHFLSTITLSGAGVIITKDLVANEDGLAVLRLPFLTGPTGRLASMAGTCTVRSTDPGSTGSVTEAFTVYPALRLSLHARVSRVNGSGVLIIDLKLAAQAQVSVVASLPMAALHPLHIGGKALKDKPLQLVLPLGSIHGPGTIHMAVSVLTATGVRETQTTIVTLPA